MLKNKKKFIDKKNSVTFHLVHRSQKDPLIADENAPQRVLVPVNDSHAAKQKSTLVTDPEKRKEEQKKYGIYFDDNYDYLQHLKDVTETSTSYLEMDEPNLNKEKSIAGKNSKINLPSSVFESKVEEKVGLLHKANSNQLNLDLDPDIVAAMDDDFDYDDPDNELEDDFIALADASAVSDEDNMHFDEAMSDNDMFDSDAESDEMDDLVPGEWNMKDDDTKSHFTEYSMSSAIIRRNGGLSFLDDKFEKAYASYQSNEIGSLDTEDIEGNLESTSNLVLECLEELEEKKQDIDKVSCSLEKRLILNKECSEDSEDDLAAEQLVVETRDRNKWDCESILSTHSNIYNHPKLIDENTSCRIRRDSDSESSKQMARKNLQRLGLARNVNNVSESMDNGSHSIKDSIESSMNHLNCRPTNETPEQRRERKQALKALRKGRLQERKANINAFKEEKKRQEKILANERQNLQGKRIL